MMRRGVLSVVVLLWSAACGGDDDGDGPVIDAAPAADADPACVGLTSVGGFSDCSVCDAIGAGCDTVDVNGSVSRVCDCTAPCPCGLVCGDIEIAPGITVGNVCTR